MRPRNTALRLPCGAANTGNMPFVTADLNMSIFGRFQNASSSEVMWHCVLLIFFPRATERDWASAFRRPRDDDNPIFRPAEMLRFRTGVRTICFATLHKQHIYPIPLCEMLVCPGRVRRREGLSEAKRMETSTPFLEEHDIPSVLNEADL